MWFGDVRVDTLSATQWIHYVEKTRGEKIDIETFHIVTKELCGITNMTETDLAMISA